jgi:cytochrome c oxidase assembly factor CtaG
MSAVSAPPAPHWPEVLGRWHFEPVAVALVAVALLAYLRGRRRTASGAPWDRRDSAFLAGLGAAVLALVSPVGTYAEALLSVHMVQHLLLALVAAPLLVGSHPLQRLLGVLPDALAAEIRRVGEGRVVGFLLRPVVCWLVFAVTGWIVHFSPLFDLALRHPPVHGAEHALFLASGVLFWAPVFGVGPGGPGGAGPPLSYPLRLLYLALAMPQNTFLALAISSATTPLYETYGRLGRQWGPSLLADQRQGGGIMWVAGDLALLVAVLAVAAAWGGQETRRSEEEEEEDAEGEVGWPGSVSGGPAGPPPSPRTAG